MTITGAIVLFAVIWFLSLFIILPLNIQSQDEAGNVVPGTPASAPEAPELRRKFKLTSIVTVILWAVAMAVIMSGIIHIEDIDFSGLK